MTKTTSKISQQKNNYTAEHITVLHGLEPVRKRPGMYIGNTAFEGLHHLVEEIVDNSVDEAMAGFCTEIQVNLLNDFMVEIMDNGRGIPVDIHKETKKSALEVALTILHSGGKFDSGTYKVSGGLHGVGVSVVNALSSYLRAEVRRDGKIYAQEYKQGNPLGQVKPIGKTTLKDTGTKIIFQPDKSVFSVHEFNLETILIRLRQHAYLTPGIKINITDKRKPLAPTYNFYFEGGIKSYVRFLNSKKGYKHSNIFYINKDVDDMKIEIALQYNNEYQEEVLAFTNNIYNPGGGMHVAGFKGSLTRTINTYARNHDYLKEKDENLTGEDLREGLTAVVSIKLLNPQFEGQTKDKLGNVAVKAAVETLFSETLNYFLEENPKDSQGIIEKCLLSYRARLAARAARTNVLRKGALEGITLPGKLADCSSKDPSESELFIVEGDSAGGSAKQGRNREFQAILPLRGKILNIEKAHVDKLLSNDAIKSLVIALGTNIDEQLNIDNLRYHRVIIMTDADVDGSHIRTLLLALLYRHFLPLIQKGHIYIAQPPLYKMQFGKKIEYIYNDNELQKKQDAVKLETGNETLNLQRYKGLGEMNADQLWDTTMNPETRVMRQITIQDASKADEIFTILMGGEVEPRKHFIQTHAKLVKNLDI